MTSNKNESICPCFMNKSLIYILIIIALTFFVYSFMLQNNFKTQDDTRSIVLNEDIRDLAHLGKIFRSSFFGRGYYYRPLVSVSYMIEYHLFGLNAFYYYLTNIFLHTATAVSLLMLMTRLFKRQLTAFAIALLFAIHPIQWEAVSNISGRAILLTAFLLVNSFRALIAAEKKGSYALALFLFWLALLCKESAGIFPGVLVCYLFFFGRQASPKMKPWFLPVLPFFGVNIVYVLLRHYVGVTGVLLWPDLNQALLGFLTFLKGVVIYLRILVLPVDLHFDRAQRLFGSFFEGETYVILLMAIIARWTRAGGDPWIHV